MSLFGSINMGANTLRTMQVGLHVVGNNIANANTPGFIREETLYSPSPPQRLANIVVGTGVQIEGIVQRVDAFTQSRLVSASGERAAAELQQEAFSQLEKILGELTDTDISSSMSEFFGSIAEIINQPESVSNRSLAVLSGESLTDNINRIAQRAEDLHTTLNQQTASLTDEINGLSATIHRLNGQITSMEGGTAGKSNAGALRVQRNEALTRLSEILSVDVREQASGAVNVLVGGEFIVFEGHQRSVALETSSENGPAVEFLVFDDTRSRVGASGGELAGLYDARDNIVRTFQSRLDEFATTLANEFNQVFSRGQGLTGYDQLTAATTVLEPDAALDIAGLPFSPTSGAFDVQLYNEQTGLTATHRVLIDLDGLDTDTSPADVVAALDAIDGLSASLSSAGELTISSDTPGTQFAFADDSSGTLAALGINTFFSGTSALDLEVNAAIRNEHQLFAASGTGVGEDTLIGVELAGFPERPLDGEGGRSITQTYDDLVNEVAHGSAAAKTIADGLRNFESTLAAEVEALSGVNLDEEIVEMVTLQRIYQASARYIQEVSGLLDVLVNL